MTKEKSFITLSTECPQQLEEGPVGVAVEQTDPIGDGSNSGDGSLRPSGENLKKNFFCH
jgi:hypothetical protein